MTTPALPKIIFDPADHSYRDSEGKLYPSVTQILKAGGLVGYAGVSDEQRTSAMELGTRVHWMLQLYDEGALNTRKLSKAMRGYLKAWRTWKAASGFTVCSIEDRFIYDLDSEYAGTIDRIGVFTPGIPVILDIKTGTAIPDWVRIQLAAYAYGVVPSSKLRFTRRIAFQPYPDGTYKIKEYPPSSLAVDFAKFMEALKKIKENNNDH